MYNEFKVRFKATIPDFVPVILTWVYIIITVPVYSYNKYNEEKFAISVT